MSGWKARPKGFESASQQRTGDMAFRPKQPRVLPMQAHHRTGRPALCGVLLTAVLLPLSLTAGGGPEDKASDQKARAYLKKMSEYLAGLKEFSIVVDEAFDTVDDEGLKLQSNRRRRIWVSRPDQ